MSRRTRIKHNSHRFQLGRIHHNKYAQSQTYFPQSYSIFGSPISMPTRFMPLYEKGAINYVCSEGQLLNIACPLLKLQEKQLSQAKSANITVSGKKIKSSRESMPEFFYIFGMACCCLLSFMNPISYRKKFFTRYSMTMLQYQQLGEIISRLTSCENLILNIQDNQLTQQKMKILTSAIGKSMGHEQVEDGKKKKKHVTIRNYCYYMKDLSTNHILSNLGQYDHLNAIFVWQKVVAYSSRTNTQKTETESFMISSS